MPTTADWDTYQGFFTAAVDALETGDKLGAIRNCLKAKMIALAMAGSVASSGTNVNLLVQECDSLREQVVGYFVEVAKSTANGRLIRTGLRNAGRTHSSDGSQAGGVNHD